MTEDKMVELILKEFNLFKRDLEKNIKSQINQIYKYVKEIKIDFNEKFNLFESKVVKLYNNLHENETEINKNMYDISNLRKEMVEAFRKMRNIENAQALYQREQEKKELKEIVITTKQKIVYGVIIFVSSAVFVSLVSFIFDMIKRKI